ncbi:MAG: 50S ribosomal protein L21 [Deltaproteobacteria bacterium]|nr:50S ribosomal protein L21 [Deltaproteobacteria bacterium]
MYAVIRTGGKQYRVAQGDAIRVEKLEGDVGSTISFEPLLVGEGETVKIGQPLVTGAKVEAEIVAHGRGKKVIVFKLRRRKNYRRKIGHRQDYTQIRVKSIEV